MNGVNIFEIPLDVGNLDEALVKNRAIGVLMCAAMPGCEAAKVTYRDGSSLVTHGKLPNEVFDRIMQCDIPAVSGRCSDHGVLGSRLTFDVTDSQHRV